MIYFDDCFDVLIKNETIEKIISIIENEERKERINNIEIKADKDNSCDMFKDIFKNKIYKVNKSRVLRDDFSMHQLLRSLEKLIRFTDISSLFKTINKEQIKSLSKVVGVYFNSLGPFLYFPSVISLILNYLIIKNIKDVEEEEFIFEIEKQLLLSREEAVNSLIGKRPVINVSVKYDDIPLDFSLTFLLFGGLWIATDVFCKFKHFHNFQLFFYKI
jgi:hypothetical protein